ncbi:MAG: hypothetical protein A2505_09225 [Deltaproteobacteria bacterium RIFOXYD12_FULL_55_16]|nr:MAG: hypothetical protein A2505_09225 [Deltaproteobacteria bacterium RIFOXYD12_FULL_55_16]
MPDKNCPATPPIPAQAALDFLQEVRQLVAFQQAIGIRGYPRTPELARFIAGNPQPGTTAEQQTKTSSRPETARTPSTRQQTALTVIQETTLAALHAEIEGCQRCQQRQNRRRIITEAKTTGVKLLIISDAPSAEDDLSGLPMSGEPGLLLDRMLAAIGLSRAEAHLSLLTRCHAAEPPDPQKVNACLPFLLKEIEIIAPRIICTMGALAAQKLLHTSKPLSQLRGRFHDFQGIALMPTFSPEFLLKTPEMKKATWLDLQLIQKRLSG